ncbi:hypothetical protein PPL_00572 [Heterostelium album PN500]|uniref:Ankyrin repeat-containing protein n=1 Tax=Heterostelium pallidum (strain ATCC 26659 / Pp 5 / PN500) TaxID=670386 RepID=D3AWU4_HETP5|nr:hypothetical protein PPL_00572 [Heterostelium album PN500]EFA86767.1 hypothetical protein PPL_00572 [Heterostelium album PN500]|eukprot:XP_020438871.1 hypothetical protein PPL_00572 [Heterostelium album PN500]
MDIKIKSLLVSIFKNRYIANVLNSHIKIINDQESCGYSFKYQEIDSFDWIIKNNYECLLREKIIHSIDDMLPPSLETIKLLFLKITDVQLISKIYNHFKSLFSNEYWCIDSAAITGNLKVVEVLLEYGLPFTNHALENAAKHGHLEVVKLLLNKQPEMRSNCLDYASSSGNLDLVSYLHQMGVECTVSAIDNAAAADHMEVMDFLMKNRTEGCSLNTIIGLIEHNHYEMIRSLLKKKLFSFGKSSASQRLRVFSHSIDSYAEKIVITAIAKGNLDILRFLVEETKYVEVVRPTFLDTACSEGHLEIVKYMLDTFELQNKNLTTSLELACSKRHHEVVEYLLNSSVKYDAKSKLLDIAMENGDIPMVTILREHNFKLRSSQSVVKSGNLEIFRMYMESPMFNLAHIATILFAACGNGHLPIVKNLFEQFPHMFGGHTALDNATTSGNTELVRFILENVADLKIQKQTLCSAAALPSLEIVKLLIERFHDDESLHSSYPDAMMLAAENGSLDLATEIYHEWQDPLWNKDAPELWLGGSWLRWKSKVFEIAEAINSFKYIDYGLTCDRGNLKMIQWLLNDLGAERVNNPAYLLRLIAMKGHSTLLERCFENESLHDIMSVFDGACLSSNLAIVKWLIKISGNKKIILPHHTKSCYQYPKMNETIISLFDYGAPFDPDKAKKYFKDERIDRLELLFKKQLSSQTSPDLLHQLILSYLDYSVFYFSKNMQLSELFQNRRSKSMFHREKSYDLVDDSYDRFAISQLFQLALVCKAWFIHTQRNIIYLDIIINNNNTPQPCEYLFPIRGNTSFTTIKPNQWSIIQPQFLKSIKIQVLNNINNNIVSNIGLIGFKDSYQSEIRSFLSDMNNLETLVFDIHIDEKSIDFISDIHSQLNHSKQSLQLFTYIASPSFTTKICERIISMQPSLSVHLTWSDYRNLEEKVAMVQSLSPVSLILLELSELVGFDLYSDSFQLYPPEFKPIFNMKSLRSLVTQGYIDPDDICDNLGSFTHLIVKFDPEIGDHNKFCNLLKSNTSITTLSLKHCQSVTIQDLLQTNNTIQSLRLSKCNIFDIDLTNNNTLRNLVIPANKENTIKNNNK